MGDVDGACVAEALKFQTLPVGKYTVAELRNGREVANYSFVRVTGEGIAEVKANQTTEVELVNDYTQAIGEVKVQSLYTHVRW
jgi:hypothetical protein